MRVDLRGSSYTFVIKFEPAKTAHRELVGRFEITSEQYTVSGSSLFDRIELKGFEYSLKRLIEAEQAGVAYSELASAGDSSLQTEPVVIQPVEFESQDGDEFALYVSPHKESNRWPVHLLLMRFDYPSSETLRADFRSLVELSELKRLHLQVLEAVSNFPHS